MNFVSQSFYLWAFLQSILIAVLIGASAKRHVSKFYALFFVLAGLETFFQYMYAHSSYALYLVHFMFVYEWVNLLYGPMILLAYKVSINGSINSKKYLVHLIPSTIFLGYYFIFVVWKNSPLEVWDWVSTRANLFWLLTCATSLFFYCWIIYQQNKGNDSSQISRFTKPLLIYLILKATYAVIAALYSPFYLVEFQYYNITLFMKNIAFVLGNGYMIYVTAFWIFNREYIFQFGSKSTSNSQLDLTDYEGVIKQLALLMENDKVYLQTDLSKQKLADMLEVPAYILSKIINEKLGASFWDYINQARVERAKELLEQTGEKMLAVAIKSGYNSESVFYKNFRKSTGLTPKKYQDKFISEKETDALS